MGPSSCGRLSWTSAYSGSRLSRVSLGAFTFGKADPSLSYIGIQESGNGHIQILFVPQFIFLIIQSALVDMLCLASGALSPRCFVLGCITDFPMHMCDSFGQRDLRIARRIYFFLWMIAHASLPVGTWAARAGHDPVCMRCPLQVSESVRHCL